MEADGCWSTEKDEFGTLHPKNDETLDWMERAAADFSGCLFIVATAGGTGDATETLGEVKEGDVTHGPAVKSIQLYLPFADFEDFVFPGLANFKSAVFKCDAIFDSATFLRDANFVGAALNGNTSFAKAAISGFADFRHATFGPVGFRSATFTGDAHFQSAAFTGDAHFESVAFSADAFFRSASFSGDAYFHSATFSGTADFESGIFAGDAHFNETKFLGTGNFGGANFSSDAFFLDTKFFKSAFLGLARFQQFASFERAHFLQNADFGAIGGERAFTLAGAVFEAVPDFIQAHFEEAPRLDNLKVHGRWVRRHGAERTQAKSEWRNRWHAARHLGGRLRTWPMRAANGAWRRVWEGNPDIPARWRALKRLAIQGHDTERELEFHAREMQSQRFEDDWPLPFRFWSPASWAGALRFWAGLVYGFFSDYGRSITRPLLFWLATAGLFAMYFLAAQPYVAELRRAAEPHGFAGPVTAYAKLVPWLWSTRRLAMPGRSIRMVRPARN